MKLEFRTHALHFSFEKFRKCNLCNLYSKLFKRIHVYINYIFLIKKFSRQKNTMIVQRGGFLLPSSGVPGGWFWMKLIPAQTEWKDKKIDTVYWVLGMQKCFDTRKESLETRIEAEYKLNNIAIDNGQRGLLSFRHAEMFWHTKGKFRNTKRSWV